MKNIILVVTHKNVPLPEADCLKPIIVGKGDFEVPGALRDNTGNNISEKRKNGNIMTLFIELGRLWALSPRP